MNHTHILSWANQADNDELADVVFDAVRNGPSKYNQAQRAAWVPVRRHGAEWAERLAGQVIAIARDDTRAVGFMSLASEGYIDFAFIRPDAQGTGLFRRLFDMINDKARATGESRLWTHASLMAQSAFTAVGFTVIEHQVVPIGDQHFDRAMMEKAICR